MALLHPFIEITLTADAQFSPSVAGVRRDRILKRAWLRQCLGKVLTGVTDVYALATLTSD